MITETNIRPIPKYMLNKIEKLDKSTYQKRDGKVRFYRYYTKFNNELAEVIVACKHRYNKFYCKQVIVHGIDTDKVYLQDIARYMGFVKVGWYREGFTKYRTWHDYDWGWNDEKYFYIPCDIVNIEFISTLPEFKYAAVDQYKYWNIMKYLHFYKQYPQTELLVKAGLSDLATSKQVLNLCEKDKQFCKWLYAKREEIKDYAYYTSSILKAYRQNKPIRQVYNYEKFKNNYRHEGNFTEIKQMLNKNELEQFTVYLAKQDADAYSYTDYLRACNYLQLDMSLEKNRYPKDFKRWHDIRIDEYHSKQTEEDERQRKELYEKFGKVADKYLSLERLLIKDDYICIIAKSPKQLIYEGQQLNHCVGRMGYDQKFAREETLIFFVRNRLAPFTPFVTLEYSLKDHKVLQCYGDHDTKPANDVLDFVNNKWLPYANRKLKKLVA